MYRYLCFFDNNKAFDNISFNLIFVLFSIHLYFHIFTPKKGLKSHENKGVHMIFVWELEMGKKQNLLNVTPSIMEYHLPPPPPPT